jgi:parallel beta-helix repeat protein
MSNSLARRLSKKHRLSIERLEDRLTPAFYAVPDVSQTLSTIGIPDHSDTAPTGTIYYVAPNATGGPSTNPNAPGNARLTLGGSLPDNATIVFADGKYRDVPNHNKWGTNISADHLTLQAAPGAKPWILGSKVANGWSSATTVTINNVDTILSYASNITNPWFRLFDAETDYASYFNDVEEVDSARPTSQKLDMVFIDGLSLKQVFDNPTTATLEGNTWFGPNTFWMGDVNGELRIYIGANPANKTVEATAYGRGITNFGDAPDLTIRGLGFAHFAFTPIDFRSTRSTFESNTFAWNGYNGLTLDGQLTGTSAADALIRNNRFIGNGGTGVGAIVSDRMLVQDNYAAYNNVEGFRTVWSAAGAKFAKAKDMVIRGNTFDHNFATGLWTDIDMFRTMIVQNLVRDNSNQGIFVEISHDNTVAFNLIARNGTGILISGASNTRVYNNTLAENGISLNVKEDSRTQYTGANADAGSTYDTYDNSIVNNIFAEVTGTRNLIADFGSTTNNQATIQVVRNVQTLTVPQQSSEFVNMLNWNAYYDASAVAPAVVRWDPTTANDGQISYATLATFKSAHSAYEANGRFVDPMFVGTGVTEWEKYALKSNSSLAGVGAAIPTDILTAVGRSATAPLLTGAIDVVSGGNIPPTITTASAASPAIVSGTMTTLSVLASDDTGEANLTYTWSTTGTPPAPVTFSANGTNASKNTIVTFTKAGSYSFLATITDAGGSAATSSVNVTVNQTLTSIVVTPATTSINTNATQQFAAQGRDQFGVALSSQPTFAWSIQSGGGTISSTGLYTAPNTAGSASILASALSINGTATVTIVAPAPATPTALTATVLSTSSIRLNWSSTGVNTAGFYVEYSLNGNSWTRITVASSTARNYTVTGLAANTSYQFRMAAYSSAGLTSPFTSIVSAKTKKR